MSDDLRNEFGKLRLLAEVDAIEQQPGNVGVPLKTLLVARLRHLKGQLRVIECKISQERYR